MALSKESLKQFASRLDDTSSYRLLELGGGASTVFWQGLIELTNINLSVMTLEHDHSWINKLKINIESPQIQIINQRLRQVDSNSFKDMFLNPGQALNIWKNTGEWVPEKYYNVFTIANAFYGDLDFLQTVPNLYNLLIVDGPHGNGRSLVFPLMANVLTEDALVLIDDFDHYPFLNDLAHIFNYKEIARQIGTKRWVLLQLQGRKT